jgi:hypothetical protein
VSACFSLLLQEDVPDCLREDSTMKKYVLLKLIVIVILIGTDIIFLLRITDAAAFQGIRMNSYDSTPPPCATPSPSATPDPSAPQWHCGPVMAGIVYVHPIFWFPSGISSGYTSLILRYYTDLSSSDGQKFYNITNEYYGSNGDPSTQMLDGGWTDISTEYPHNPLTSQDIQHEIQIAINHSNWRRTSGYNVYFPIYVGSGEQALDPYQQPNCFTRGIIASSTSTRTFFGFVSYPDANPHKPCHSLVPDSPNGNQSADSAISISAHIQFEAVTDPLTPNTYPTGWFPEIGDTPCEGQYGTIMSNGANHIWNNDPYIIQLMRDLDDNNSCQLSE